MSTPTATPPAPPTPPTPAAAEGPAAGDGTRRRRLVVAGVVVVQLLLVLVAVWSPLSARLTGQEVRLRVAPLDPVDPFRGAYVQLTYPDLPGQPQLDPAQEPLTQEELDAAQARRGEAFVPLSRQGEVWVGGEVVRTRPSSGLYLRCDDSDWRLDCGIESWFLPQDDALALEAAVRDGSVVATVKVDGRGHAALVAVQAR